MKKSIALLAAVLGLSLASVGALAERADSLKEAVIQFDDAHIDPATQSRTLVGHVVLTRGTLTVQSDNAVIKESPEGYAYLTLTSAPGKLATFRQKSDGGPDLWFEGQAERIEYDERAELVKLFSKAIVKQTEGAAVTQEMDSAYIAYDSRKQVLVGHNDPSGADVPGKGRGTMTYLPIRKTAAAAGPAAAAR